MRSAVTGSDGLYTLPLLQPGVYNVRASLSGFRTAQQDGVRVTVTETSRVVFELDSGEATKEPPHYEMVAVPEKKKVIVSLWGSATYDFKKEKAETLFKKSSLIKKLTPVQIVDDGLAILEFTTANKPKVEIFHLSNPARIVLDFKP